MKTKRPPALTSPWKIGFLVSLLLIFLSIGVNYLIFRTFNLSWSSVGFKEGNWYFHRDQFVKELLPLVALIAIASMVAYFAITSAVRKYKAYLDSGHDYRRLISSIQKAGDLDSEDFASKLGKYPELRKVLTRVRDQIRKKEKELEDWEKKLKKRGKDGGHQGEFEKECRTLAEAIPDLVRGAVDEDLNITSPGLAGIEEKLRSLPAGGQGRAQGDVREQIGIAVSELRQAGNALRNRLNESSSELGASCGTARELEKQLSQLSASFENAYGLIPDSAKDGDMQMLRQSLKAIQALCEELSDVGEECKSIAINTALRAGAGEGTVEDIIQLAEDVRKVALKFIDLSQSFDESTERMRTGLGTLESERDLLQQRSGSNSDPASSVEALKNKMSLWVERVIVLNDNLKNTEEIINLSLVPIEGKLSALAGDAVPDLEGIDAREGGLEDELHGDTDSNEIPENEFELETVDSCAFDGAKPLAFDMPDSKARSHEIPGIEKNPERIFSQTDGEAEKANSHVEEQVRGDKDSGFDHEADFEELPTEDEIQKELVTREANADGGGTERAEENESGIAAADRRSRSPVSKDKSYSAEKLEGQVSFNLTAEAAKIDEEVGSSVSIKKETSDLVEEVVQAVEFSSPDLQSNEEAAEGEVDEEEDIIDLYSLGAVDIG